MSKVSLETKKKTGKKDLPDSQTEQKKTEKEEKEEKVENKEASPKEEDEESDSDNPYAGLIYTPLSLNKSNETQKQDGQSIYELLAEEKKDADKAQADHLSQDYLSGQSSSYSDADLLKSEAQLQYEAHLRKTVCIDFSFTGDTHILTRKRKESQN